MTNKYILKGHEPVPCSDLLEWGKWFETATDECCVGRNRHGGIRVSTVFLGLDHSFALRSPALFETMVFGGRFDGEQRRYSTWDEAEEGHRQMCEKVFVNFFGRIKRWIARIFDR